MALPDFRAFPKKAMSSAIVDYVLADDETEDNYRSIMRRLPLLPEERAFVDETEDPGKVLADAYALWNHRVESWDDPDSLDAEVKTARALCDGDTPGGCDDAKVLERFNETFDNKLTKDQFERRNARVAELRRAMGYMGPTFAPLVGRKQVLRPIRRSPDDALAGLMKRTEAAAAGPAFGVVGHHAELHHRPPLNQRSSARGLAPIVRRGGGRKADQKWLNDKMIDDLRFKKRSANALTIEKAVDIDGVEVFVKVASLDTTKDDPVRDAFSSLIMSAIIDPETSWTADFIGVRACYDVDLRSQRRRPPIRTADPTESWWVNDENYRPAARPVMARPVVARPGAPEDDDTLPEPEYEEDSADLLRRMAAEARAWKAEENTADMLARLAAEARAAQHARAVPAAPQKKKKTNWFGKLANVMKGGDEPTTTYGFKNDGTPFTHLALFYRNSPGDTMDSKTVGPVTNRSVTKMLQRIIDVGTMHGLTHNDLHTGNVMLSSKGLCMIDYGRVVFRDLQVEDGDDLFKELTLMQREVTKIPQDKRGMTKDVQQRGLRDSASQGYWDVFAGIELPVQYTWIPDVITCTLWMLALKRDGSMRMRLRLYNTVNNARGSVGPADDLAARFLTKSVNLMLKDPTQAHLAPGMALYGMFMYYAQDEVDEYFHSANTLLGPGGPILKEIVDKIEAGDAEAVAMFEVVLNAMEKNGLYMAGDSLAGGGPLVETVLEELEGAFATTMVENAELRVEIEEANEGPLSPAVTNDGPMSQVVAPVKAPLPLAYKLPPASAGLPGPVHDKFAIINDLDDGASSGMIGVGDYDDSEPAYGGGRQTWLAQIALSCVVVAASVFGSMH
jgi:hypothetical protein